MTSLPQIAVLFDQSFYTIFSNYLPVLKYFPFIFGPYLLSLMTLKKSDKDYLCLFALNLLIFRFFLQSSDTSETNLVLDENQITLGKFNQI
jgi:hypothetical protein